MIKEIAWNMFDTFLELRQLENLETNNTQLTKKVEANEYSKNERNNNFGK